MEKDYWNTRYETGGTSGYGSYGEQLAKKLEWITPLEFNSITEVGCGDFNFGSNILKRHPARYIGLDISEVIVNRNRELYPDSLFFTLPHEIPPADLLLCVDVLLHVIKDEDAEKLLNDLEKAWTKYLVLTAYERDEEKTNHVRIRKFDYKRFGEPIIREIIEEDGTLMFYVYEKAAL